MTSVQETRIVFPLAVLMLSQPVFGQNSLDLVEADARNAAYTIMSAAEEQFDCEFEEYSMRDVGNEPDVRYVFHVRAEGDECREALIFATNMAARDDKLMFRQVQDTSQPVDNLPILHGQGQMLIYEVNPEIDDG